MPSSPAYPAHPIPHFSPFPLVSRFSLTTQHSEPSPQYFVSTACQNVGKWVSFKGERL
jgi:hypothetical protein